MGIDYRQLSIFLSIATLSVVMMLPQAHGVERENVARAQFTTEVLEREPTNRVVVLNNGTSKVLFFTEIKHLQGRKIFHRWEYNGVVVDSVPFDIKGPRWRVYSSRELRPEQLGKWTVVVTDEDGWPLKASIFEYVDKAAETDEILLPPVRQ